MELTQRRAQAYRSATKKQKGKIIARYCELTEVSRNLAGKRFRKTICQHNPRILTNHRFGKKKGRKPKYMKIYVILIQQA